MYTTSYPTFRIPVSWLLIKKKHEPVWRKSDDRPGRRRPRNSRAGVYRREKIVKIFFIIIIIQKKTFFFFSEKKTLSLSLESLYRRRCESLIFETKRKKKLLPIRRGKNVIVILIKTNTAITFNSPSLFFVYIQ